MCQVIWDSFNQQCSYGSENPFYSQIWPLTSICDIDLVGRDLVIICDTLSHDSEQLNQVFWGSFNQQGSCIPDKPLLSQIWPFASISDLDLVSRDLFLYVTLWLIPVNSCPMVYQNQSNSKVVAAQTSFILSQIWPFTSISELDLVVRDLNFICDTSAHDSEQLCHVITKSFNQQESYSPTNVRQRHGRTNCRANWQTNGRTHIHPTDIRTAR